jgi:DNA-3-methyladenine glycosylase I
MGNDPLMCAYHDEEWGRPERDSRRLWEKLILDTFQAGLSWRTVLHKRTALRQAFHSFEPSVISAYTEGDVQRLLSTPGIIRNKAKIQATIHSARAYLAMETANRGSFSRWCWAFVDGQPVVRPADTPLPTKSALSELVAKELKAKGFRFVGPTTVYAWMQAVGMVDDHEEGCFRRGEAGYCCGR